MRSSYECGCFRGGIRSNDSTHVNNSSRGKMNQTSYYQKIVAQLVSWASGVRPVCLSGSNSCRASFMLWLVIIAKSLYLPFHLSPWNPPRLVYPSSGTTQHHEFVRGSVSFTTCKSLPWLPPPPSPIRSFLVLPLNDIPHGRRSHGQLLRCISSITILRLDCHLLFSFNCVF